MHTFTKKRIAIAVGAALVVMAGAANAAAPVNRATNPSVVSTTGAAGDTTTRSLLSTNGLSGQTVTVSVNLTSADTTAGTVGDIRAVAGNALGVDTVTTLNVNAGVLGTLAANNNVDVYTGTLAVATQLSVASATLVSAAANATGLASITVVLNAQASPAAYRVNAGNLQYTSNNGTTGGTAVAFADVKLDVKSAAAGATGATDIIIYTDIGAVGYVNATDLPIAATQTSANVKNSLAPTPNISTTSASGGALVNGFSIDTATPITLVAGNLEVRVDSTGSSGVSGNTIFPAAAMGAPACATSKCSVTFAGLGTAATSADLNNSGAVDAADVALYISNHFNTGVGGVTVPYSVDGTATEASYTEVFNVVDGAAAKLAKIGSATAANLISAFFGAPGSNITDGAAPAIVSMVSSSSVTPGTTTMSATFSEPLLFISTGTTTAGAADIDLKEVAENMKVGTDSLASLNLNAGGTLALPVITAVNGQGVLQISGIQAADVTGKSISVDKAISVAENNDAGFTGSATVVVMDPTAGVKTATANEFLTAAATTVTAPPLTIAFTGDTTASAPTTVADATKVGSIIIKFKATKEIVLNPAVTAKTLADLANDLVVRIQGVAGQTPVNFQYHPVAADLAISAAGDTLTITLPTALIYSKIDQTLHMDVDYTTTFLGGNALVSKTTTTTLVSSGTVDVALPLTALATNNTLLTQSIRGTLTGASNGSLVRAHLAKWTENPSTAGSDAITIVGGKISRNGDAVTNNLGIQFVDLAGIQTAMATSRNNAANAITAIGGVRDAAAAKAAAAVRVYASFTRSNDTRPNNNGQTAVNGDNLISSVELFSSMANAIAGQNVTDAPIYELMLDPITGNLTGTLTGKVDFTVVRTPTTNPGMTFPTGGNGVVAEGLVGADGKFNLLAGVDPASTAVLAGQMASWADHMLILVHEDQANTRKFTQLTSTQPNVVNFVAFEPNLASLKGTRTVLGVAPGIAGPVTGTGTAVNIDLSKYRVSPVNMVTTTWQIRRPGNPAVAAVAVPGSSFARSQVCLNQTTGVPTSAWAEGTGSDMAMSMTNSKAFFATELGANKSTLNTIIQGNSFTAGAVAYAFKSDGQPALTLDCTAAQGNTVAPKVGVGWSLVSVPSSGTLNTTTVDAIIKVGVGSGGQYTWLKADGTMPTQTAFDGVFVYSAKGGPL